MADTVSKSNNDHFDNHAKLHRDMADHSRQMVSLHKVHFDNLISATGSSDFSNSMQSYSDWWTKFSQHVLNKADTHEHMAGHLDTVPQNFDQIDKEIHDGLSNNNTGQ